MTLSCISDRTGPPSDLAINQDRVIGSIVSEGNNSPYLSEWSGAVHKSNNLEIILINGILGKGDNLDNGGQTY